MASSAVLSIRTDSIVIDLKRREFHYYGTQRIERQTSVLTRQLVTTGAYSDVPRTENNPHGMPDLALEDAPEPRYQPYSQIGLLTKTYLLN
ncbi:MAG: hypothetical protein U5K79_13200 [Cyclobacteriaceae bacterium]|nr:hypothetical protein [Cyclobacteriaceae bacterium]